MPDGKGYGPQGSKLTHHTDGATTHGRQGKATPSSTTPKFKNVGDPRQKAHTYDKTQGHSGGQGSKRSTY